MKHFALLFFTVPVFAMDTKYEPLPDFSAPETAPYDAAAASSSSDVPAPAYWAEGSDTYEREVVPLLFDVRGAKAKGLTRLHVKAQSERQFAQAVNKLGEALRVQHKQAFYHAAQLALLEMDMSRHDAVMRVTEPYVADVTLHGQEGITPADLVGLKLLLKGDAIQANADAQELAKSKMAVLCEWIEGKNQFYASRYDKARKSKLCLTKSGCISAGTAAGAGAGVGGALLCGCATTPTVLTSLGLALWGDVLHEI